MEIRQLTDNEKLDAMPLVWEVFTEFEAPDYRQEGVDTFKAYIEDAHTIRALEIYGAFDEQKLIGVLALRNNGSHISLFFVDRRYHRQGVGRKLYETFLQNCKASTITVNSSPYAHEVYRKLGFEDTDGEQTVNGIRFFPMRYQRQS